MNNINFFSNDQRFVQLIVYFVRVKKKQHQPGIGGGQSGSLLQWYRQGEVLREGQGRENRKYGEKGDRRAGGRAR